MTGNVLRKHVSIIHAHSMMSSLQRKAFNYFLYEASKGKDTLLSSEGSSIDLVTNLSDIKKAVKFNSKNTSYLRESIDGLASIMIEWNLLRDKMPDNISFLNMRALHGSPTFHRDGSVHFSLHKFIFQLVGSPQVYGTIDLDKQADFESRYSHALYENSTRFLNMLKNKVINLGELRKILGVSDGFYGSVKELNKKIIKPSVEEVNDRSSFTVNLEPIKQGRSIVGYDLSVHSKSDQSKEITSWHDSEIEREIKKNFGQIKSDVLNKVILNRGKDYILSKIQYTKENVKKDKTGFYPAGYFIKAIQNDWKSEVTISPEKALDSPQNKEMINWEIKRRRLSSDVRHWERSIEMASGSDRALKEFQKNLGKSRESLSDHLDCDPRNKEVANEI